MVEFLIYFEIRTNCGYRGVGREDVKSKIALGFGTKEIKIETGKSMFWGRGEVVSENGGRVVWKHQWGTQSVPGF